MDCNITTNFLAEWHRMCFSFCGNERNCPVTLGCGVVQCSSCRHIAMTGGDIIDIVQEWSDSHPVKTRLSVFLEQYPNVILNKDSGLPSACAGILYGFHSDSVCFDDCNKCWNTPIEDGGNNA